jgi:hypothetical protein
VWVMMGANGGKLDLPNFALREEGFWEYTVPEFEQLREQKPYNTYLTNLPWGIYSLVSREVGARFPARIDIGDMDYPYLVAGFYTEERLPGESNKWRWTGPAAILRVPWPSGAGDTYAGAILKVRARQESPSEIGLARPQQPLPLTVYLDDTRVGQITVRPSSEWGDYELRTEGNIPRGEGGRPEEALLRIESPTWSPQSSGTGSDARALGVQIDLVEVSLYEATP